MTTEKMSIIDQLKANEKPFGLMSEEMQKKMCIIGKIEDIEQMVCRANLKIDWVSMSIRVDKGSCSHMENTFRLRADYTEEQEIEECEIKHADDGSLAYLRTGIDVCGCGGSNLLFRAFADPDFIGFKFEDGYISAHPVLYMRPHTNERYAQVAAGYCKVLHATHVLFQRQT